MEKATLRSSINALIKNSVLDCEVKDSSGLNDFQKLPDEQGIAIPKVGITRYRIPMNFKHADGTVMNHDCEASMYVNLPSGKTGINMSRLCSILQEESVKHEVGAEMLVTILRRYQLELRDYVSDKPFERAHLKLKFNYPVKQKSLKSENWGWQYYASEIQADIDWQGKINLVFGLNYEYSSTCPCSLSMAKQYEADYAAGRTQEGNGIGVAHGQRSGAQIKVKVSSESDFKLENLIKLMREAIPTETQSLVKRVDEQAFAILNGANPMFVEHASKRIFQVLNAQTVLIDWIVALEHWESLHSHNAAAVIYKGIDGGFREDPIF